MIENLHRLVQKFTQKEKQMGNSNDMVDAMTYAMMRTKEEAMQRAMMDMQRAKYEYEKQAYMQNALGQNNIIGGQIGQAYGSAAAAQKAVDPNDIAAYAMRLSDLVAMWELKYRDTWVSREETNADEFWKHGVTRLNNNGLLEAFPQGNHVRLKERCR